MANTRLIARLDVKGPNLIKGVHLEGLRIIGDPQEYAQKYYEAGIDEILYMDIVASLYQRNNLTDVIRRTVQGVFVPICAGGGIRSVADVKHILRSGADKVAINTAATERPDLITEVARQFGSQCMVLSIEAKRKGPERWEVYTNNGREPTGLDVVDWARLGARLGAGEILLTSIDQEGTRKGFDVDLIAAVTSVVTIPVIASGGMGKVADLAEMVGRTKASAAAIASVLHFNNLSVPDIREDAMRCGIRVRRT